MSNVSISEALIRLPRLGKRLVALSFDIGMCALTVWLAWSLRLERWEPWSVHHTWATAGAWALGLPVFTRYGLYASIFRYAGWNAMLTLSKAAAVYGMLYATLFMVIGVPGIPRSVGVLQPLLMFIGLGLSRVGVRLWLGDLYRELLRRSRAPGVLIYGAGKAGRQLAAGFRNISSQRLVGFVDDNHQLQGRRLDGLMVYAPQELERVIAQYRVRDLLLAMPSTRPERRKQILEQLRPHPLYVRTLPGLDELMRRGIHASDLQEIDIEDLLGREPVAPDAALMSRHLRGSTVLVTGAGGSIGSELCRQILQWGPRTLLLLEHSEAALYEIHHELQALALRQPAGQRATVVPLQGSVQDAARLDEILSTWPADVIYHAAAYKHVPLVEHNPAQGLRNNVWGTWVCARAAARHGVARFVLISTDKAVRPTNVMGASKRLAEMVLQALASQPGATATCYTMVRFGNVLGSSGSVVPLFRRQIAAGGPVTLTHADITRYFMTIPEAAQLVIQAGAMAQGGDVFVLDMGDSVRIHDLACRMIELTGRRVRGTVHPPSLNDIEIRITGLRPGEKLYEELLIGGDTQPTDHPRILKAHERFLPWRELEAALCELQSCMERADHAAMRQVLERLVEGYCPADPLVDWAYQQQRALGLAQAPDNNAEPVGEALQRQPLLPATG